MAAKRSAPPDFAAKYMEFGGSQGKLTHHYAAGKIAVKRWIAEVIDDSAPKTFELADLPKGRPAEMVRERGMDENEWRVSTLGINEWTTYARPPLPPEWAEGDPLPEIEPVLNRQTKLTLTPVKEQVRAARVDGWKPPAPKPRKAVPAETTFLVGDHQAPYIDEDFHKSVLRWLAEVKPEKGVIGGDGLDLPSVSKYAKTAGWNASVNECVDSFYRVLCDYRSASPDTEFTMLAGNHEARLHAYLMRQFEEGAAVKRAGEDSETVLSVPYLLRLDELGIPYLDNYPHAVHKIAPTVGAVHGTIVKKDAGASGHATLMQRGFDVYEFHIHRQGLTPHTWHDIDGEPYTKWACEVGAACLVKEGLNHTVAANWQNGAATATIHKDGSHVPELAQWINKRLCWRGERF